MTQRAAPTIPELRAALRQVIAPLPLDRRSAAWGVFDELAARVEALTRALAALDRPEGRDAR
jgi:hypothetical protein